MSMFVVDVLIWILLFAGIGFGLLSFIGLLIFPDIRSRRFTAMRALLISMGLLACAVIVFGLYKYAGTDGEYAGLLVRMILLMVLLAVTTLFISRYILRQIARKETDLHKGG